MGRRRITEAGACLALACLLGSLGAWSCMNSAELARELQRAAAAHDVPRMARLLEQRANPNAEPEAGNKPLIYAIQSRDPQAVQLLLEHGADPNVRRASDSLPAVKLARYLPEIRQLLVKHGAITQD